MTDADPITITGAPVADRRSSKSLVVARRDRDELHRDEINLNQQKDRNRFLRALMEKLFPDTVQDDWPDAVYKGVERQLANLAQVPPGAPVAAEGPGVVPQASGDYFVRDGAIYRRVGRFGEVQLSNFTARVVQESLLDDGNERTRRFVVRGSLADGTALPPVEIPSDQFEGMGWVTREWGSRAIIGAGRGTKDFLREAIQRLNEPPVEQVVFSHTGWREVGGKWVYLHGGGGVGGDGPVPAVGVRLSGPLAGFVLPDPPDGEELVRAVRASLGLASGRLVDESIALPLLGAIYRAPLGGTDFSIHLVGQTSSRKSQIAALAQQHFGPSLHGLNLPGSWLSTANANEQAAFLAKDTLFTIDDFNPTGATDPQKLHAAADRLFRAAGNASGRSRLDKDLSFREGRPPRSLLLSTGEDTPRGHSIRARLIILELSAPRDELAFSRQLSLHQKEANDGVYARAMAGYVRWLAAFHYPQIRERLPAERIAERDRFLAMAPHGRTATAVGDLFIGITYLARFAHAVGAITPQEAADLLGRSRAAIAAQIPAQTDQQEDGDPVEDFLQMVPAILASGRAHLARLPNLLLATPGTEDPNTPVPASPTLFGWRRDPHSQPGSPVWVPQGRQMGWVDNATVYLDPNATYAELQALATQQRKPIGMSPRTLWARLAERGLLSKTDNSDKGRVAARVPIIRERAIHMPRSTLGLADDRQSEQGVPE